MPLFLAVVVCLTIWQVWLTWRLMEPDRHLAAQQSRQRLEQIADLAVAQLGGALDGWDLKLRELDTWPQPPVVTEKLPAQATLVLIAPQSVVTYPRKHLLFVPEPPAAPSLPEVFENAAKLEYRDQNYSAAIEALRPLAEQPARAPKPCCAWLSPAACPSLWANSRMTKTA